VLAAIVAIAVVAGGNSRQPAVCVTSDDFPTPDTTGPPDGWQPADTIEGDYTVSTAGAVVEDLRIVGSLVIAADDVTVRRVEVLGGWITNETEECHNGLLLEDVRIALRPDQEQDAQDHWVIGIGGYTARRVEIWDRSDGFRVGGKSLGCGPVTIEDSFVRIADWGNEEWHGDGVQGYDGAPLTIRNMTVDCRPGCGTAPFFYPVEQGNTSADVERMLVMGGGYSFRNGMPGRVVALRIVDETWGYNAINVRCSVLTEWEAQIVTIDSDFQVVSTVRDQPCDTEDGA
jgi:hypothetical protein